MPKYKRKKRVYTKPSCLSFILLLVFFLAVVQYYRANKGPEKIVTAPPVRPLSTPAKPTKPIKPQSGKSPVSRPVKAKPAEIYTTLSEQNKLYENLVYGGLPKTAVHLQILANRGYYAGFSEKTKTPLWVAYRLDRHLINKKMARPHSFKPDMRTESKITYKLYARSGYDKGHLAPNAAIAQRFGKTAQYETFLMSNIAPQTPALNRKVWQRLEKYEEECSDRFDTVWVITGPIFGANIKYLANTVEIPEAFYKIIIDEQQGSIRALAFIVPQNVVGSEPISRFIVSIDEIEAKTGLDFLWPLNDGTENTLEAFAATNLW